ncbi:MAG: hypothetical protein AABX73_03580 [Nanoarchaeota archaeon]
MLPRWHIFFGAVFSLVLWFFIRDISLINLALVFLASVLIDFDHYAASVIKTGRLSLIRSFDYHKKNEIEARKDIARGIRRKGDFHLFHTIEFHLILGILGLYWKGFFYIFIGMVFHSLLDIVSMAQEGSLHRREYFFFNWLRETLATR